MTKKGKQICPKKSAKICRDDGKVPLFERRVSFVFLVPKRENFYLYKVSGATIAD